MRLSDRQSAYDKVWITGLIYNTIIHVEALAFVSYKRSSFIHISEKEHSEFRVRINKVKYGPKTLAGVSQRSVC